MKTETKEQIREKISGLENKKEETLNRMGYYSKSVANIGKQIYKLQLKMNLIS